MRGSNVEAAIVPAADLLANDMLGGFVGSNLTLTGVSNFTHGTGFLDANGFVHFTPAANYYGPARRRGANDELYLLVA